MTTSALILMITVQVLVTCITGYFFYKVLKTPAKAEPDSYSENDDEDLDHRQPVNEDDLDL